MFLRDGQYLGWRGLSQDAGADVIPWDPSKPYTGPTHQFYNAGCPNGYFAQFVGSGYDQNAYEYAPGKYVRCRRIATSSPATVRAESGVTWAESADALMQAARQTAEQAGAALKWGVPIALGVGLLAAIVALR